MEEILGLVDQFGRPLESSQKGGGFRIAGSKKVNPNFFKSWFNKLPAAVEGVTKQGAVVADDVTKGIGKGTPYAVGIDALLELSDSKEPLSKNVADAVGSGAGTALGLKLGTAAGAMTGVAAPVAIPILSLLGAYLLSEAGGEIGGGIYNAVNPDGVQDFKIKKMRKAGELEAVKYEIMRDIERQNREAIREDKNKNLFITGGF